MPYADKEKQRACEAAYRKRNPEKRRALCARHRKKNLAQYAAKQKEYYDTHPEKYLYITAKSRAKKKGIVFTILESDIVIPELCPVLGFKLQRGSRTDVVCAPSVDRLDPSLGYVPGNVAVISRRANMIKSDANLGELKMVAAYMRRKIEKADQDAR